MNTIDEEGRAQVWKAVYMRYFVRYEHEADSLEAAYWFLAAGQDSGDLSSVGIIAPDGTDVYDEAEMFRYWEKIDGDAS